MNKRGHEDLKVVGDRTNAAFAAYAGSWKCASVRCILGTYGLKSFHLQRFSSLWDHTLLLQRPQNGQTADPSKKAIKNKQTKKKYSTIQHALLQNTYFLLKHETLRFPFLNTGIQKDENFSLKLWYTTALRVIFSPSVQITRAFTKRNTEVEAAFWTYAWTNPAHRRTDFWGLDREQT